MYIRIYIHIPIYMCIYALSLSLSLSLSHTHSLSFCIHVVCTSPFPMLTRQLRDAPVQMSYIAEQVSITGNRTYRIITHHCLC